MVGAIDNNDKHGEITLKDLVIKARVGFSYLRSKWIIILFAGVIGGIIGLAYAFLKKPLYVATSTFVLEESGKSSALGQYAGLASMVGIDLGSGSNGLFQGDNIIQLYKSRSMLEKVLLSEVISNGRKELLINRYLTYKNLREKWQDDKRLNNINFNIKAPKSLSRLQDSIITETINDLNKHSLFVYKPDKKTSIIVVEVKTIDESFSKAFNDQMVKTVNDFYVQTKTKKSLENLNILQHQTDSVRNVLNGAIYKGAAVIDATPNLNPTRQILRVPIQKSQFNAEANKAILTQLVQNLELSKLSLRQETPLIQIIDKPTFPLFKDRPSKSLSMIVVGMLAGFLTVLFLILKKVINESLK